MITLLNKEDIDNVFSIYTNAPKDIYDIYFIR